MNMNNLRPPISIGLFLLVLVLSGCERLSNGVVREIDFPEHTPEIVVTLMARNQMDSLVSRAHSSAGILDGQRPRLVACCVKVDHHLLMMHL